MTREEQLNAFRTGFPWLDIDSPATAGHGIHVLDPQAASEAAEYASSAKVNGRVKFVPASGAASRMFKDIFAGVKEENEAVHILAAHIREFAFFDPEVFLPFMTDREIAAALLEGLGYGHKPKGVLKFHRYPSETRTAFAEHLVEGQEYMRNPDGSVKIVFTISEEHRGLFEKAKEEVERLFSERYGVRYDISFTYQDKATDTIAVTPEGEPFICDDGTPLTRPAGHGALIYNLDKIEEELVSIKNIDNVAVERLLPLTSFWKKVLMGKALQLRDRIFSYLHELDKGASEEMCAEIKEFLRSELCITLPRGEESDAEKLRRILDRPIRVCGMVKNQGDPGGGPFIIRSSDGSTSLQILESVQINPDDPSAREALSRSSYFNPVDLVCCLRDYKGRKFDLLKYVDPSTGFISSKSYEGRPLRALELPGLWNGAMSGWNTLFVEVPLETFNPVKTVLDLLKPAHV